MLLGLVTLETIRSGRSEATTPDMQPAMLIDLNRCTGCHSCVIACKEQHHTPAGLFNTRIEVSEHGSYPIAWQHYRPELCHQCQDAPCVTACDHGATFALANGIVVTDWTLCTGDGACVAVCPYQARSLNREQGDRVEKCDFCIDLLAKGLSPACVEACAPGARVFGSLTNPEGKFSLRFKQLKKENSQVATHPTERVLFLAARKGEPENSRS